MANIQMKELLEAGVHFGHQTRRWNPKMKPFIFGKRNGIHIVDLQKTLHHFEDAAEFIRDLAANGRNVLFVGTKRQAQDAIREEAERCGMFFMNHRWLGGTLTNWKTVSNSISRLKAIDEQMAVGLEGLTKKERLGMERDQAKLQASLGGIREMGGVPDLLFVIDVNKEDLAIAEARKLSPGLKVNFDTNGYLTTASLKKVLKKILRALKRNLIWEILIISKRDTTKQLNLFNQH